MQTGSEQLKSQQAIMEAKNFYNGQIDGIWGPKTIAAKIKWERHPSFPPATPNNGFPLADRGLLPAGIRRLPDGNLTCDEVENANAKPAPAPVVAPPAPIVPPPVVAPVVNVEPVIAAPVEVKPGDQIPQGPLLGNQQPRNNNQHNKDRR